MGILLIAGAVTASLRNTALLVGLASVASFLLLALSTGRYNAQLGKVVAVDGVALVALLGAALLQLSRHRQGNG